MIRTTYPDIFYEQIKSELFCDPSVGEVYYINNPSKSIGNTNGEYTSITFKNRNLKRHRLIWYMVYGQFPDTLIDHINGIKSDDRISNLRLASPSLNGANIKNIMGYTVKSGRFSVKIKHDGNRFYIGTFDTPQEAQDAYVAARAKIYPGEKFHKMKEIPQEHLTLGEQRAKPLFIDNQNSEGNSLVFIMKKYIEEIRKFETQIDRSLFDKFKSAMDGAESSSRRKSSGIVLKDGRFMASCKIMRHKFVFGHFDTPEEAQACYLTYMILSGHFDEKKLTPINSKQFLAASPSEREESYKYFDVTAKDLPNLAMSAYIRTLRPTKTVATPVKAPTRTNIRSAAVPIKNPDEFSLSQNGSIVFKGTLGEIHNHIFKLNAEGSRSK